MTMYDVHACTMYMYIVHRTWYIVHVYGRELHRLQTLDYNVHTYRWYDVLCTQRQQCYLVLLHICSSTMYMYLYIVLVNSRELHRTSYLVQGTQYIVALLCTSYMIVHRTQYIQALALLCKYDVHSTRYDVPWLYICTLNYVQGSTTQQLLHRTTHSLPRVST